MTKRELRRHFAAVRDNIPREKRTEKSRLICGKFLSLPQYKRAETVMIYMSFRSEPETAELAEDILKRGKRLIVPKCKTDTNEILPCEINSLSELETGSYGILEPRGTNICGKSEIDIVLVPALAFDRAGCRLGYGGGYYDRFLKDFGGLSAGLCYSECLTDRLPRGEFDVCADIVLTD